MSRGETRKGHGTRGPPADIDWDEEFEPPATGKPGPKFPNVEQSMPTPLTSFQRGSVEESLRFRMLMRNRASFTDLDLSRFEEDDEEIMEPAGLDPFDPAASHNVLTKKRKRYLPDISNIPFVLENMPKELWSTVDPNKTDPIWKTLNRQKFTRKAKQEAPVAETGGKRKRPGEEEEAEDEEDDIIRSSRRKKRRKPADPTRRDGQKDGLEAEDDLAGSGGENVDDIGSGDDLEPEDSDFSEGDFAGGDDYDAEGYFEAGEDDDADIDRGGDEGAY